MTKNNSEFMLTPGNDGIDCICNGTHTDNSGNIIECCCDECNYLTYCFYPSKKISCSDCSDTYCPRSNKRT